MSRFSAKNVEQRGRGEKNYKVFALNFHGSGLDAIRNELIRVVSTGLRRPVYIVDLDEEERRPSRPSRPSRTDKRTSKNGKDAKKKDSDAGRLRDVASLAQNAIERCRKHYDFVTQTIERERRFDLLTYWVSDLQNAPALPTKPMTAAPTKKPLERIPETRAGAKTAKGDKTAAPPVVDDPLWHTRCVELKLLEHNRTGAPEPLGKRKYIADEPLNSKLFILLTGRLSEQLYKDLLSRGEPLQILMDFLPSKCAYDFLLPHPENDVRVEQTLEQIQEWVLSRRKLSLFKEAGILQESLPTISRCLAAKLANEIYTELCWCVYDAEALFQEYQLFYVKSYHTTNVAMEASVNVGALYEVAESLGMQGHYLNAPLPAMDTDATTLLIYLSGLLSTVGPPTRVMTNIQTMLLSRRSSMMSIQMAEHSYEELLEFNEHAFSSITKISKYDRIFTDENNRAMCSLVTFADHERFYNIYLCCLEYNLVRGYLVAPFMHGAEPYRAYATDEPGEPVILPTYVKLHLTVDSVKQRLTHLLEEYDDKQVDEFHPGYKLYTFRRALNEVFENDRLIVLPSRLCFRDFTLFQKDEFLADLVTPEERRRLIQERNSLSGVDSGGAGERRDSFEGDSNIFIRPNSLAAQRLKTLSDISVRTPTVRLSKAEKAEKRRMLQFDQKGDQKRHMSIEDYVGLPPGHPLLQGYNLEDVRQEIHVKTSKYYFEEGRLQLYEERWCFDDTNKYIELLVHRNKMTFCAPRHSHRGLLHNIRLITRSEIAVRIYGVQEECARVVINYPNGLAIYYHELYAEQMWCNDSSPSSEELRRVYSPLGVCIVYYKDDECILVMRYNGEVFRLYQHEPPREEEEEMMEGGLEDVRRESKVTFRDRTGSESAATTRKSGRMSKARRSEESAARKRKSSLKGKVSSTDGPTTVEGERTSSFLNIDGKDSRGYLAESIENELKFLLKVCNEYSLHYINLILTTSTGRNVHISHKGTLFEADILENFEWHDYYANEAYSMRSDGVYMLWTKDSLKCYHSDGTVIITKTEEGIESADFEDFDSQVAESSSHHVFTDEVNIENDSSKVSVFKSTADLAQAKLNAASKIRYSRSGTQSLYKEFLMSEGEGEAVEPEDTSYVSYWCDNYDILHRQYAQVQLFLLKNFTDEIKVMIEINAADRICVQVIREETYEEELLNAMEMQGENYVDLADRLGDILSTQHHSVMDSLKKPSTTNTAASAAKSVGRAPSSARGGGDAKAANASDVLEEEKPAKYIVKLWIGSEVELRVSDEVCEIGTVLDRYDEEKGKSSDKLDLKLNFTASINATFQEFVSAISLFKNYTASFSDEHYFIERILSDCTLHGFEFFEKLPVRARYKYAASNSITEFTELPNIHDNLANVYPWFDVDMWKFPRFRDRRKRPHPAIDDFPMVLSARIYCKVPHLLRNTEEIHKFLDPLDAFTFKTTRHQIKETMDYYVRPQIQVLLNQRVSTMSWRRRHREHKRRLFIEQQRKTLYYAMLKHNVYPQYFQFISDFRGHIKYVDFFDFMRFKCEVKPTVLTDVMALAEPPKPPEELVFVQHKKSKRRCPRYD